MEFSVISSRKKGGSGLKKRTRGDPPFNEKIQKEGSKTLK